MEYREELFDKLEKHEALVQFESSMAAKVLKDATKQLAAEYTRRLLATPATETLKIAELQILIKFYTKFCDGIINAIKSDAEVAFDEAKASGYISKEK